MSDWLWWRDGVVYQIYPRSFLDANGDGVGDLEGIRRRLDHLAWLGVDAIWISPFYPSPMADFGYDVADYCGVDPLFGTLADFDRLLADAHARGIRVVVDWVPNHSSDRHPWFVESRSSRTSAKRDWYVWRDPAPDGGPPNNWFSNFGGPAWTLDPKTGQYYLHSFLPEQPDLNWRNPELVAAMHATLRFWLDRGVDGFRTDVGHRILKDPLLRDNPPNPNVPEQYRNGFLGQLHLHDENHPDVHVAYRAIRRLLDAYDERMMVGEIYIMDGREVAKYLGDGDELHLSFHFKFVHAGFDPAALRREVEEFEALCPAKGWPTWTLSNHDVPRHATRFDHPSLGDARARLAALLLLTLRGTPFLYYGEEIGMRNVPVAEEAMQDPLARRLHPRLCRDGERSPMCWEPGPGAGFTAHPQPWLPLGPQPPRTDVASQCDDRTSLLWLYKDLLALRRAHPSLQRGDYRGLDAPDGVWSYERRSDGERARVALNFSDAPRRVDLGAGRVVAGRRTGAAPLPERAGAVELGPAEGIVAILA
ncbi:MAG: alpha-amylase [Proteobacteria bacterium]|nr:MAG: alpha-amylase [Pseudomonadota bacterium]